MKRICFVASSGGHLEEISCLKSISENNESFLVTERSGAITSNLCEKVYYVRQMNRKEWSFIFNFIKLFIQAFIIFLKEKPEVILTTGALISYPFCLLGKLMNKKVIYIESFARVDSPSLTGKLVYKFADLFIVQWEELLEFYPSAVYVGGIF